MLDDRPIEIKLSVRIEAEGARQLAELLFESLALQTTTPQPTVPDTLLDTSQAAKLLGISKSSLCSLRYTGDAPPAYQGRKSPSMATD